MLDLIAIKNDFQYLLSDAPKNKFMGWIKDNTDKNDVFFSKEEILDPITLSGRKNYVGHAYYMGYDTSERKQFVKEVYEVKESKIFDSVRKKGIRYIVIPIKNRTDFNYKVDVNFLTENLEIAYQDDEVLVFKL